MQYQIWIEGELGPEWSGWFNGWTITPSATGQTILSGMIEDQAALYGLIMRLNDLGLSLIAVARHDYEIQPYLGER
ncbi:hypothetical protein KFU94_41475 [Chloroflexi bacterium TSY]|nr:hypothetical protein [Chloroflexi bacterium TSY]